MAEYFNIPFHESLLKTTLNGENSRGHTTTKGTELPSGTDKSPVYKKYEKLLSDYDKYRIEMVKHRYYAPWGYQCKHYDGKQYSDDEIYKMMSEPFLCEQSDKKFPDEFMQAFRSNFAKLCLYIMKHPTVTLPDGTPYTPIPWLKPDMEHLEEPLYDVD